MSHQPIIRLLYPSCSMVPGRSLSYLQGNICPEKVFLIALFASQLGMLTLEIRVCHQASKHGACVCHVAISGPLVLCDRWSPCSLSLLAAVCVCAHPFLKSQQFKTAALQNVDQEAHSEDCSSWTNHFFFSEN